MRPSIGNGWQLNFPWISSTYLHLWDGQGYRIPASFWDGTSGSFENHQGEHFRLVRNATIILYTASGTTYLFDTSNRISTIEDTTGNNTMIFRYDASNRLSNVTDTANRVFKIYYNSTIPVLIQSINQTFTGGAGSVRGIVYTYDSKLSLISVTDPARRVTLFSYQSGADPGSRPWILTRVTYPTSWYSNYTFSPDRNRTGILRLSSGKSMPELRGFLRSGITGIYDKANHLLVYERRWGSDSQFDNKCV